MEWVSWNQKHLLPAVLSLPLLLFSLFLDLQSVDVKYCVTKLLPALILGLGLGHQPFIFALAGFFIVLEGWQLPSQSSLNQ